MVIPRSAATRDLSAASPSSPPCFFTSPFFRYNSPVDPLRDLGRFLLLAGVILVAIGVLLYFSGKLPFRLGRLPGDIVYRGEHTTLYFPIATCLLLSLGLSLIFWLISHFRR